MKLLGFGLEKPVVEALIKGFVVIVVVVVEEVGVKALVLEALSLDAGNAVLQAAAAAAAVL